MTLPCVCEPANDRVIKNERAGNIFGGNQTFNGCAHLDLVFKRILVFYSEEDYSKLLIFSVIQLPVTEQDLNPPKVFQIWALLLNIVTTRLYQRLITRDKIPEKGSQETGASRWNLKTNINRQIYRQERLRTQEWTWNGTRPELDVSVLLYLVLFVLYKYVHELVCLILRKRLPISHTTMTS